jgi:hypothetical protein
MAIKHKILANKENEIREITLTPARAIRYKCLECSNFSSNDVKDCHIKDCALYPYRLGKNPSVKNRLTDEQKKAAADRAKKLWEKRASDTRQK